MKTAMIFAAGLGTRLRPLTEHLPKALVRVGDSPLLGIVLRRLVSFGYDRIVVNVHHFAGLIEEYLDTLDIPGVEILVSDERDLLRDTGGGILHAEPLLGGDRFLVHNVDILSDLDLDWLEAQVRTDAVATLAVSDRKTSRYLLFNDDMRLAGWTDISTGEVRTPFCSLDVSACRKYAFSGIHILSHDVFSLFRRRNFGERFPIMDFYLDIAAEYPVYGAVPDSLELVDVGKPETLAKAGDYLRCHPEYGMKV